MSFEGEGAGAGQVNCWFYGCKVLWLQILFYKDRTAEPFKFTTIKLTNSLPKDNFSTVTPVSMHFFSFHLAQCTKWHSKQTVLCHKTRDQPKGKRHF